MAKNATKAVEVWKANEFAITKENGKDVIKLSDNVRSATMTAVNSIDKLIVDYTPLAINLWVWWKQANDAGLGWGQFCRAFDPDGVPESQGRPGSAQRKLWDSNKTLNRLTYLVKRVGRYAAGEGPKPPDPKVGKQRRKKREAAFKAVVLKYKIPYTALDPLFRALGWVTKEDNKLNATAKALCKAVKPGSDDDE